MRVLPAVPAPRVTYGRRFGRAGAELLAGPVGYLRENTLGVSPTIVQATESVVARGSGRAGANTVRLVIPMRW